MKVLLVHPTPYLLRGIPIGLALISAILKKNNHIVDLFDTTFMKTEEKKEKKPTLTTDIYQYKEPPVRIEEEDKEEPIVDINEELTKKIGTFQPDLIAVASTTETWYKYASKLIKFIKKGYPKIPVIAGGVHPTLHPEEAIDEADFVCVGEGENTMVELCDKLEKGEDTTNIKNLWVKKDGQIHKNELRPLVDLDYLPSPDWSLFDQRHLIGAYQGKILRRGHYVAMRGCPNACAYCVNNFYRKLYQGKGKFVRWEGVDKTIENLKKMKEELKIDILKILDDLFAARSVEELTEFRNRYKKEIGLPFLISISPPTVVEEKIKLLKDAGCVHLSIGLETGNENIRKKVLKRYMNNKQMYNAFKVAKKFDMDVSTFNIVGIPHETRKDIFKTIEMNRKGKVDTLNVYHLYPYPKTDIRDYCENVLKIDVPTPKEVVLYERQKYNFSNMPLEEVKGLKKTFILYVKMPKAYYPLIRICEKDSSFSNWLTKKMFEHMQRHYIS